MARTTVGRSLSCAVAGIVSLSAVPCEQPPRETYLETESTVQRLLASSDPREQSWGAWLVGRDLRRGMVPALEQVVWLNMSADSWREEAALDAALDSLIQLNEHVPQELALALYDKRPVPALILLSNWDAAPEAELMALLERASAETWYVIANILVGRRATGVARVLLDRFTITLQITVMQPGELEMWRCGLATSRGLRDVAAVGPAAADFPPRAEYQLTRAAVSGAVVVNDGPVPIYYVRSTDSPVVGSSATWVAPDDDESPRPETVLKYLGNLALVPDEELPLRKREHRVIWRGQEALDGEVARLRAEALREYSALIDLLINAEALTAVEAEQLTPRIDIHVSDQLGSPVHYNTRP